MPVSGGSAAIKGLRLQTLYALHYALGASDGVVLRPEGEEDLDVVLPAPARPRHVQVKAYSRPLSFRNLADEAETKGNTSVPPYFLRALDRIKNRGTEEIVVVFGRLGSELAAAWEGHPTERGAVTKKLLALGLTDAEVGLLFRHLRFECVNAAELEHEALGILRHGLTGGDPEVALDALSHWLLRKSEERAAFPASELLDRASDIGRAIHEIAAQTAAWGRTLVPLKSDVTRDRGSRLREEFYLGIGARPEHIHAGVDIRRPEYLARLHEAFAAHRVVVLRGASGQGKSALAYRYLAERVPIALAYEVRDLGDARALHDTLLAVAGHVRAFPRPLHLLVDVRPGDTTWIAAVAEFARLDHVRVLVTIREEDWTRARSALEPFEHGDVPLDFARDEAHALYTQLVEQHAPPDLLDFDEAWARFGHNGPLLEFVYLLTHAGESLRARLARQVDLFRKEYRDRPAAQEFFHAAAAGSAYHARLDARRLANACELHPLDARQVLETLQHEHLLRVGPEGSRVEGLHAIRSEILAELLSDPTFAPREHAALLALPAVSENDLELYLLHALNRLPDPDETLRAARALRPVTWSGRAGVLRALVWWGVREHVQDNRDAADAAHAAFGFDWWLFLSWDLLGLRERGLALHPPELEHEGYVPPRMRETLRSLRRKVARRHAEFPHARAWLAELHATPTPPVTPGDWIAAAELAFWAGLWNEPRLLSDLRDLDLTNVPSQPLGPAADLHWALWLTNDDVIRERLRPVTEALRERFKQEAGIARMTTSEDGRTLHADFVAPEDEDPFKTVFPAYLHEDAAHAATMRRLAVMRRLYPEHERYGSQGHGHRPGDLPGVPDETHKDGVTSEVFPPMWGRHWYGVFDRLCDLQHRVPDWRAHAERLATVRRESLAALNAMTREVAEESGRLGRRLPEQAVWATFGRWRDARDALTVQAVLPRCAVDEWGLAGEGADRNLDPFLAGGARETRLDASRHDAYLKALRAYTSSLTTFITQAGEAFVLLVHLRASPGKEQQFRTALRFRRLGMTERAAHLSIVNLDDTLERLETFQREFRERFAPYFSEEELATLEEDERDTLRRLWEVWGAFARPPRGARVTRSYRQVLDGHRRSLEHRLRALQDLGVRARIIDTDERHEGDTTLWIAMDVPRPPVQYVALEHALHEVHLMLKAVPWRERALLLHEWRRVAVVPTCGGRPWRAAAWVNAAVVLLDRPDPERWWLYAPHPIAPDLLARLGLPLWPLDTDWVEAAQQLLGRCIGLRLRLHDLRDLHGLDATNPATRELARLREQLAENTRALRAAFEHTADLRALAAELSITPFTRRDVTTDLARLSDRLGIPDLPFDAFDELSLEAVRAATALDVVRLHWEERELHAALLRSSMTASLALPPTEDTHA